MRRYVLKRLAWSVVAVWIVISAAFLLVALTPDPNEVIISWAAGAEAAEAYRQARNYDLPLYRRYWLWLSSYLTLDLGTTQSGQPVTQAFRETLPVTALYVVPAVVVSTILGVATGLYTAIRSGGYLDRFVTAAVYSGFGLPVFWLGEMAIAVAVHELGWVEIAWDDRYGLWHPANLQSMILPATVVCANLLAVQARYARAEALEYVPAEFVRTLRASGASSRDVARHVLRNAALPLVSLFCIEGVALLLVTVYVVESVFGLPGAGALAYDAIYSRDIGVVLAATLLVAVVGVLGNLLQDVLYVWLDPRVDVE
ncbi:MAG: ABC transporter permease [Halopenitus sp.]